MKEPKGIRARRVAQVISGPGSYVYGSGYLRGLVESARMLLLAAQRERQSSEGENFLTSHGPAAIMVTVTAFETFINEVLTKCLRTLPRNEEAFSDLIRKDSLVEKFRQTPHFVTGRPELLSQNIELMQHVRHEIVHWYPRPVGDKAVPEWLEELADAGLLYSVGIPPKDIGWLQKLQSFQLARWCGAVAASAAKHFADALVEDEKDLSSVADCAQDSAAYFGALII